MNKILQFFKYYLILCGLSNKLIFGLPLTENEIREDIKFLSQTQDGIKPSRLRALLLADLKKSLLSIPEINSSADADLKVTTQNCTCIDYTCERFINYGKRSRIQRNCEDYCCRRKFIVKKSAYDNGLTNNNINYGDYNNNNNNDIDQYQYKSDTNDDHCVISNIETFDSFRLPWIVQIISTRFKHQICVGSLIHPQIVLTTLVCANMQMNELYQIRLKEKVDKFQNRYQMRNITKKILPENHPQLFEDFGFNVALLILDREIEMDGGSVTTSCLARSPYNYTIPQKCFVQSIENYKGGRQKDKRDEVQIYSMDQCLDIYRKQNREQMFFPKANICASPVIRQDENDLDVKSNGAPLICVYKTSTNGDYHYIQQGILSWPTSINQSPHLFVNINNFKNWIDKSVNELKL